MPATRFEPAPAQAEAPQPKRLRVAMVTNFAPHYRVKMFEALAALTDLECFFHSDGGEWYWQKAHGVNTGGFRARYLPGFWLGGARVVPTLLAELLRAPRFDAVVKCINDRFALPVTYLAASLRRAPFILWTGVWCRIGTPSQRLLFPLTRYLYRHAGAIVAYGEHVRQYLIGEGVPAERIFLAPQAVDNGFYRRAVPLAEQLALRASLEIPEAAKVVLYLGRLEPIKGIETLIEAFASLRGEDAVLVLCGTGSLESALRKLAEAKGIAARVRFAGYVAPADAVRYYGIAWTGVLPSVTMPTGRETWGLVINEAFNQGVPMIATTAVGAAAGGLVRHGVNGFVVPEGDPRAIGAALERILPDAQLRHELGRAARRDVLEWNHQRQAEGFRAAVEYALDRTNRGSK